MAVTKIWTIRGKLEKPIDYAMNPEKTANPEYLKGTDESLQDVMDYAMNGKKTEKQFFVSGVNCNPSTAKEQFITVKKQFGKEDGIIAYHAYQSFAEGKVTAEQAHQIGVEFAKRVWGKDYQVIVSTHLNTKCLHNHFVVNSISFRHGRRCRNKQWYELKVISDELCKAHALSIVKKPEGKGLPYQMAAAEQEGKPTRLVMAKEAVDEAIRQSYNMREFHQILKEMGYICQFRPDRKYWTIQQKNWKRPIRLARLGEEYTNERIEQRVLENPPEVRKLRVKRTHAMYSLPTRKDRIRKIGGLKGLYLHYCYKLGYLPKYQQSSKKVHYLYRDDLLKMEQISAETKLLVRENILTDQDLSRYENKVLEKIESLKGRRTKIQNKLRRKYVSEIEVNSGKEEIASINEELKGLRKEVKLCKGIASRSKDISQKMEQEKVLLELQKRKERMER